MSKNERENKLNGACLYEFLSKYIFSFFAQVPKTTPFANNKTIHQKGRGKKIATSTQCLWSAHMQNEETIITEVTPLLRSESVPASMYAEVDILLESQSENKSITSPAESITVTRNETMESTIIHNDTRRCTYKRTKSKYKRSIRSHLSNWMLCLLSSLILSIHAHFILSIWPKELQKLM